MHEVVKTESDVVVEVHWRRIHVIKRRRRCRNCKTTWYTFERNEEDILRDDVAAKKALESRPEDESTGNENPYVK